MNHPEHTETLVFSSASVGVELIIVSTICGCCIGALPFLPLALQLTGISKSLPQQPVALAIHLVCYASGLLAVCIGPILLHFSCCGVWTLNNERVEFRHIFKRQSIGFRWSDVEQVHWSRMRLGLKALNTRLVAYWHWFPNPEQRQARECFAERLSPYFDLSLSPPERAWSFEPNLRSAAKGILKIVMVAIGATVLIMGPVIAVELYCDAGSFFGLTTRALSVLWIGILIWSLAFIYLRSLHRNQLENSRPFWRERSPCR